jgi:hypothetical protein
MARKKTGRLIHWGCWNYPGTAIRTACRAVYKYSAHPSARYHRLYPEKQGTPDEYIAAYDAEPMKHWTADACRAATLARLLTVPSVQTVPVGIASGDWMGLLILRGLC